MDNSKETNLLQQYNRLSDNNDYYNNVFKKTEKICSAIFYILSYIPVSETNKIHRDSLTDRTMTVHTTAAESLLVFEIEATDVITRFQHALLLLDSTLLLVSSARLITSSIAAPVSDEIDLVMRYIRNHYLGTPPHHVSLTNKGWYSSSPAVATRSIGAPRPRRNRPHIPKNDLSSDAVLVYSELSDRTTRIKTVLEAKPEATIKDLTDIITDVSAKTIQRDLNDLIDRGEVKRQGERRWSKYSINK